MPDNDEPKTRVSFYTVYLNIWFQLYTLWNVFWAFLPCRSEGYNCTTLSFLFTKPRCPSLAELFAFRDLSSSLLSDTDYLQPRNPHHSLRNPKPRGSSWNPMHEVVTGLSNPSRDHSPEDLFLWLNGQLPRMPLSIKQAWQTNVLWMFLVRLWKSSLVVMSTVTMMLHALNLPHL